MDITKAIAQNLSAWMKDSTSLNTSKKLSLRSGVGFGTVQRARNGEGNITVQNLEAIARAFGRTATDLITPPASDYATGQAAQAMAAAENIVTPFTRPDPQSAYFGELQALAEAMSEQGRWQLIGQAKLLATLHPKAKANPAS